MSELECGGGSDASWSATWLALGLGLGSGSGLGLGLGLELVGHRSRGGVAPRAVHRRLRRAARPVVRAAGLGAARAVRLAQLATLGAPRLARHLELALEVARPGGGLR